MNPVKEAAENGSFFNVILSYNYAELELNRERLLKAAIALSPSMLAGGWRTKSEWENVYQCAQWFCELHQRLHV